MNRKNAYQALDMSDAFDYCREQNRPIIANVPGEDGDALWKLYPSGRAEPLNQIGQDEYEEDYGY